MFKLLSNIAKKSSKITTLPAKNFTVIAKEKPSLGPS